MSNTIMYFKTHRELYGFIQELVPEFDVTMSLSKSRYTFVCGEKQYPHNNLFGMLNTLNSLVDDKLFIVNSCRTIGRLSYGICVELSVLDRVRGSNKALETPSEVEETESEVIVPVEEENVSQELTELISTEVASESEDTLEVDWDWVDSLEDSKENRLALDEYAEKFSVPLKRTMKVENMAKKFKEALA